MKRLVYHDEDPDGWMSAAIVLKKYPDSELYGLSKSKLSIELKEGYDEVYVLDSSLQNEQNLKTILSKNKKLIWIDHHKSAMKSYDKNYEGIRDITKSACVLTWEYLFPEDKLPLSVAHVGDYDMWYKEIPHTDQFILYLQTLKFGEEITNLRKLIDKKDLSSEYDKGKVLELFVKNLTQQWYKTGVKQDFLGYKVMLFHGEILRNEVAHYALEQNKDIKFTVVKRLDDIVNNKKEYKYSLRSRKKDEIDVGEISRKYGGGGHKEAAGFNSIEDL